MNRKMQASKGAAHTRKREREKKKLVEETHRNLNFIQ